MNAPNQPPTEIVENLFNQFADRLFAFATKSWKFSEDEAWDTIYETLFHIAKVYHRYEFPDDKRLTNFVITVFNNRLKNRHRERRLAPILVQFDISDEASALEIETNSTSSLQAVSESLDELEAWERILLIQRASLVPYSEIEKLVEKPERQLKVYYKRVLAKLEKRIREKLSTEHSNEK